MHIPDDPLYYEKFYFTPGDLGFKAFETDFGKFGTLVCWDQWYPEGARLTALQGANVLFYPTAIGWHPDEKAQYGEAQYDAWRTIQRAHAIANGVYVAVSNRVGFETGNVRGNEAARAKAWSSGADRLSPIHLGKSLRKLRTTRKRCWLPKWICVAWKMCAGIGRSGATAAWMLTRRSRSDSCRRYCAIWHAYGMSSRAERRRVAS